MNYKPTVEVHGQFSVNALVFATKEEALASARNLYHRWTLCTDYSTEETSDPVNYEFDLIRGVCTPLPTGVPA